MRAETRRQLKQDKFSRTTLQVAEQTVHWSAEHKGKLIAAAAIVIVLVGGALGFWYYWSIQDEKASIDFTRGVQTLNAPIRPAGMPPQPDLLRRQFEPDRRRCQGIAMRPGGTIDNAAGGMGRSPGGSRSG